MEETVDVRALRDRFNSQARTSDTSSRDSNSPRPGLGRTIAPSMENISPHRLPPVPPPFAGPAVGRFPRAESAVAPVPSWIASSSRPTPSSASRPSIQSGDTSKVKQRGEKLQNMMLKHQRPAGSNQTPARSPVLPHASPPSTTPHPLRQQSRQRSSKDVSPLRRALPLEGPMPFKPKRPPYVNLEPFLKIRRGAPVSASNRTDGSANRRTSLPAVMSPPQPPERSIKPTRLPRQIASVDFEEQDPYDDIGSLEKNDSYSDNNPQSLNGDDEDVYESIDEGELEANILAEEKNNKKEAKRQQEQEKKEQLAKQKKQNELKKNFQIHSEVQALHTARVRYDWPGDGKLDLSVQQGQSIEILRVENNPSGKWLARSTSGNYGYISNTCVDIDYEAIKRKMPRIRKMDTLDLPPPPPDPLPRLSMESNSGDSFPPEDDDYDDVQPIPEDFPPPPPEINIDPKVEKELKKKFKFEGPVKVLHTMMVDPNGVIKKLGSKDLQVTQGEIVEVIEQTNKKKYLCRSFGNYGYVSTTLLLHLEGDVYDDVAHSFDVYDNDSSHINK
ncbi:FYN-binding protein 1 [Nothobranchius furzeri]